MSSKNIITNRIKYFQAEYPDGVPLNILKLELDLSVDELQKTLLGLEKKGILFIENEEYVKLVESPSDDENLSDEPLTYETLLDEPLTEDKYNSNIANDADGDIAHDLTERESKAVEIIRELSDESGKTSRHIVEGNLLYGDLKLGTLGVYKLIISLENKGVIKKILINDAEYYTTNVN